MVATGAPVAIRGLEKRYGAVVAVHQVDLEVKAGEFVALLGPSGSGKTTILMTIAGFETPTAGSIGIGGRDVTVLPPNRRNIGMVFQRYALFPHMTVAENIGFPLRMRKIGGAEARTRVEAALAMVRLEGYGDRRTSQLSGGQQQRVALARALVYNPPLLLMDEPLGALDKNLREEMQLEIKRLQQRVGATVVYVTHDQSEALTMADRIAVMDGGRIQQYGPPREIYDSPSNAFVAGFIGETNFIDGHVAGGAKPVFAVDGSEQKVALEASGAPREGPSRLAIRPELIRLGDPAGSELSGTVEEMIYGGGTVACHVRVGNGAVVMARVPAADAIGVRLGDRAGLVWQADRAKVFPR
ncbi:MAG: ABC transporter ATP-binding protein [Rhizobiaceae bacterium]|nr:ABC transporter ATP-binding protein [Rhizobiaceae bacterium]